MTNRPAVSQPSEEGPEGLEPAPEDAITPDVIVDAMRRYGIPEDRAVQFVMRESRWSGPLPHPDVLEGYERLVQGAAARILQMAELEQAHRHTLEVKDVALAEQALILSRRGQPLAFAVVVLVLALAAFALIREEPAVAGVLAGTTVVSLVIAFIAGHRQ